MIHLVSEQLQSAGISVKPDFDLSPLKILYFCALILEANVCNSPTQKFRFS
jgi:hypothetical protein